MTALLLAPTVIVPQQHVLEPTTKNMGRLWNELQHLRQEVDFIERFRQEASADWTDK